MSAATEAIHRALARLESQRRLAALDASTASADRLVAVSAAAAYATARDILREALEEASLSD